MKKLRYLVPNACLFLLILLFLYTGLQKLLYPRQFLFSLVQSPIIPLGLVKVVAVAVPLAELALVGLLTFDKTRGTGYRLSALLLGLFSLYIIAILRLGGRIPCSCGGIIEKLSWGQHLLVNGLLAALALVSYYINRGGFNGRWPKKAIAAVALLLALLPASAQQPKKTIKLLEQNSRLPVEGCAVRLTAEKPGGDTIRGFTSNRGLLPLPPGLAGSQRLLINSKLFYPVDSLINLSTGPDTLTILLRPQVNNLEAATVAGSRITTGLNTITYRIPGQLVQDYTLAKSFFTRVPAVTRVQNEYVVDGNKSVTFTMNGIQISKEQAESLPASIIDRLELKTFSLEGDAVGAVVSIILKKNLPVFAKNIYEQTTAFLLENNNFSDNLLIKSKKMMIEFSANGYISKSGTEMSYLKVRNTKDTALYTNAATNNDNRSVSANGIITYDPDSSNRITVFGSHQQSKSAMGSLMQYFTTTPSVADILTDAIGNIYNYELGVLWTKKITKQKSFSVTVSSDKSGSNSRFVNLYPALVQANRLIKDAYNSSNYNITNSYSIRKRKKDGSTRSINARLSTTVRHTDNNNGFYSVGADGTPIEPPLQRVATTLNQQRYYPSVSYENKKGKASVAGSLGLELFNEQLRTSNIDTAIFAARFLPRLSLGYAFSSTLDGGLNFSRTVRRSGIAAIAARRYGVNPFLLREGNPNLKPQSIFYGEAYINKIMGKYTLRTVLTHNSINNVNITQQVAINDSLSIIRYINTSASRSGINISLSGELSETQNISLNTGLDYYHFRSAGRYRNGLRGLFTVNYNYQVKKFNGSLDFYYKTGSFGFNSRTINYPDASLSFEYQVNRRLSFNLYAFGFFDNYIRGKELNYSSADFFEVNEAFTQCRNIGIGFKLNLGKQIYNDRGAGGGGGAKADLGGNGL
jgi:putative oxidoreductase